MSKYKSEQLLTEAEPVGITPSSLYNPIVNKEKAAKLDGFKSFTFKSENVYDETLRNKIFFIAKNSLENKQLKETGMSLKEQNKHEKEK